MAGNSDQGKTCIKTSWPSTAHSRYYHLRITEKIQNSATEEKVRKKIEWESYQHDRKLKQRNWDLKKKNRNARSKRPVDQK